MDTSEMSSEDDKNTSKLNRGISSETSSDELSSSPPQNESQEFHHSTTTTDAIHPRFHSRSDLLFKCQSCGVSKAKESKIHKHFFKNCIQLLNMPKYTCPLPECGGPSFIYKFKNETRIYHSCSTWAKFVKNSPDTSILSLSSRANSSISFASSNVNGSSSANSNMDVSSNGTENESQNHSNGDIMVSSENGVTNGNHGKNNVDFDI